MWKIAKVKEEYVQTFNNLGTETSHLCTISFVICTDLKDTRTSIVYALKCVKVESLMKIATTQRRLARPAHKQSKLSVLHMAQINTSSS